MIAHLPAKLEKSLCNVGTIRNEIPSEIPIWNSFKVSAIYKEQLE